LSFLGVAGLALTVIGGLHQFTPNRRIEVAGFGDVNGDGVSDAIVYTHYSPHGSQNTHIALRYFDGNNVSVDEDGLYQASGWTLGLTAPPIKLLETGDHEVRVNVCDNNNKGSPNLSVSTRTPPGVPEKRTKIYDVRPGVFRRS